MKFLGIDYGTRKVGLALSDEGGSTAFPLETIANDEQLVRYVEELVAREGVHAIALGDTRTASGEANDATAGLERFKTALSRAVSVPIHAVPEHGTTGAVHALTFPGEPRGKIQSRRSKNESGMDTHAAALILQRFLDTRTVK